MTDRVSYLRHPCKKLLLTVRAVGSRRFAHQGASRQLLGSFSPVLLKIPNFLVEFVTPIARVSCCTLLLRNVFFDPHSAGYKGQTKVNLFTTSEYEQWLEETPDTHKWDSKYYKVRNFPSEVLPLALSASFFGVRNEQK